MRTIKGGFRMTCADFTLVSRYFTPPKENTLDFQTKTENSEDTLWTFDGNVVVTGYFNVKALKCDLTRTDARGIYILEMVARTGLAVINEGDYGSVVEAPPRMFSHCMEKGVFPTIWKR
ncbi:hypothetical protein J6590_034107 [Homalodisca vitripennis]|nr:hypothetical protein J6590_034107 [Homalodisca vitripennis]